MSAVNSNNNFKIGVLLSGAGTNLESIAKYFKAHPVVELACVLSDTEEALGLKKAQQLGIKAAHYLPAGDYKTKLAGAGEARYLACLKKFDLDLIVLAGFMRILKQNFLAAFPRRIVNLHPSLLPKYRGLNTAARMLAAREKLGGATVHFVNEEVDGGEIIAQRRVHIFNEDTPETLTERIKKVEWELYPKVIERLALNRRKIWQDQATG